MDAEYDLVAVSPDFVWIADKGGPRKSIMNDAERVVAELAVSFGSRRIIYRDSMLRWDELAHDGPKFLGFKPGSEDVFPPKVHKCGWCKRVVSLPCRSPEQSATCEEPDAKKMITYREARAGHMVQVFYNTVRCGTIRVRATDRKWAYSQLYTTPRTARERLDSDSPTFGSLAEVQLYLEGIES